MRILLISVITENLNMAVLPLGLAYVSAAAKNAGHDVAMCNLSSEEKDFRGKLKKEVENVRPQVVGISMRNVDDQTMNNTRFLVEPVKAMVQALKSLTRVPIVLGGAGYSIFPESALAYTGADMGIKGEGETAFVALLDGMERGENPLDLPGLYLPNQPAPSPPIFPKTLDGYTMPRPHVHLEIPCPPPDGPLWIPIQTRRGCPMDCSYCSTSSIEGRILRRHDPETVVETIKNYVNEGFTHFHFVDNTFNFPASYAETICEKIISENLNIKGRCIVYPARVSQRLVKKMAQAGMREVSLGFESGSDVVLKAFNKRFDLEEVRRISRMFKEERIFQMGFVMLGGPGETRKTAMETLRFIDVLGLDVMRVSVGIRIYPYTDLAGIAVQEKKIAADDNLLMPRFYVVDDLKDWLEQTVKDWAKDRPTWII